MITSLLLLLPLARGFAPDQPVTPPGDGPRPLVTSQPTRMFPVHVAVQRAHTRSPRWQAFVRGEGRGWRAIFDEHSGVPRTMWGGNVPVPMERDLAIETVEAFLYRHADVVGLESGELALRDANLHVGTNTWYLHFDELRDGVPVYHGGIGARVVDGNLVLLQVATTQDRPVTGDWVISADDATDRAIADGPVPSASHTDPVAVRRGLDRATLQGREVRRTWQVTTRTAQPPGHWVSFVDAQTGELLNVHNLVAFANGTVEGEHHEREPASTLITSPIPLAIVDSGNGTATTDALGAYTVADGDAYTTTLSGEYLTIEAVDAEEGLLTSSTPDLFWDTTSALQSEIDVYVHTHRVRDWGRRVAPSVGIVQDPILARVNLDSNCNAFYNGDINFYRAGSGCNDTGENADVIYHEWGHGFHWTSILSGVFSDTIQEGVADTVSFLLTRDSRIAPGFATGGGTTWIRDVAPDRVYPQDFVPGGGAVHSNGLIFGGAMWDLLGALEAAEGVPTGTESTERIFTGLLRGGPDITQVWGEALVADDDDGDLTNGTPRICIIKDEFDRHGIGPTGGGSGVSIDHIPLTSVAPGVDGRVEVEVVNTTGIVCPTGSPTLLHYRVNGGAWVDVPMAGSPVASADIPGQALGDIVEYYITGDSGSGDFAVPVGGEITPYSFLVGDAIELACWDFEASDGGFTSALVAGDPGPGANDWQWGNPAGKTTDPAAAFSGNNVWGNDLGNTIGTDNFNGEYQPEKVNELYAPTVPTAAYSDVTLVYRRWLSIEDATYDRAEIVVNGTEVWQNRVGAGSEHHIDAEWINHAVRLPPADRGRADVTWRLTSDPGLEFGGWTIDDVCVVVPATADNRLSIDDLTAETLSYTDVRLSWTHPAHAPVERVKLVRNFDRFPQDHTDGMPIAEYTKPALDAPVVFDDVNYDYGDSYYAVYAYDGTDWLSWTIEGLNAVRVDIPGGKAPPGWPYYPADTGPTGDTGAPPVDSATDTGLGDTGLGDTGTTDTGAPPTDRGDEPDESDGPPFLEELCGCASADPRPGAALVLLLLPLVARRRRG